MVRVSNERLSQLIAEDIPYIDLTCEVLGIGNEPGEMEYFTREDCILAGTEFATRIATELGCEVVSAKSSGTELKAGDTFMKLAGKSADLHAAWKVCLNLFDHLSAVATKTKQMVDTAHRVNSRCEILTTRKSMPGGKDLLTSAVMAGGAYPHRLGLSETVLIFDQHIEFMGGFDSLLEKLPEIKCHCIEKKLFVEVNAKQAVQLANAGVDGIQLDKIEPRELIELVDKIKGIDPRITLIAAGGINPQNAQEYAATGVDGLATTAPFSAKPLDMSVRMSRALTSDDSAKII